MSAAHTPGSLFVKPTNEADQYTIANRRSDCEGEWADIYVRFGGYFGSYGPHMFAAAPDLLNELINLTARFKAAIVQAGTDEEFAEQAVASARAAISKALPVTTKDAEVSNG